MARAQGARSQMAAVFETNYGVTPASGFFAMPFASATLGAEQPLLDSELLGQGRDPLAPVRDAVTVDGNVVVPIDAGNLGTWLRGTFGNPTTTGTGPYTHEFVSGLTSLPSLSIEVGMPEVPRFAMYRGCNVDTFEFTMSRSGLITGTVGLVAQGEVTAGSTAAGTPTARTLTRFGAFNGSITRGGSPLAEITEATVRYTNNLDRVETIRADGLIDGADPSVAALTGSLTARFANTTLLDAALANSPSVLAFIYSIDAATSFNLTAHAVYLPRPRISIEGPRGISVTFDWQAARAASPARMCTATLINAVVSY